MRQHREARTAHSGPVPYQKKEAHAPHTCREVDIACVNGPSYPDLAQGDRSDICILRMAYILVVVSLRSSTSSSIENVVRPFHLSIRRSNKRHPAMRAETWSRPSLFHHETPLLSHYLAMAMIRRGDDPTARPATRGGEIPPSTNNDDCRRRWTKPPSLAGRGSTHGFFFPRLGD